MNRFWKSARTSFLAGLLVVGPMAASVIVLLGLFNWVTNFLLPGFVREQLEHLPYPEFLFRLVALVLCATMVTVVGWVTRRVIGRQLPALIDSVMGRVPLLNRIYGFMKEVSQTMLAGKKTVFQRVVLVEYPRLGVHSLGFVTNEHTGEAGVRLQKDLVSVFFPTTPNPTSGWLALIPRDQLIDLDMSVSEGVKMVISGGTIIPGRPALLPGPASGTPEQTAMDYQRAQGIVLRRQPVTETSLIVTWFTRECGKLRTMAKGARRPKSPFTGKLDLFYEGELVFLPSQRSDLHLLHECFLENPRAALRQSVARLTAASYCLELVELITPVEDPQPGMYALLGGVLDCLATTAQAGAVLLWFEMRLLETAGWRVAWAGAHGVERVLRSLAATELAGALRVRLSAAQLADARRAVWAVWDAEVGRAPRARALLQIVR